MSRSSFTTTVFVVSTMLSTACGLMGCGQGDGVSRATVSGKVSYQGEPIEEGAILFVPAQGVKGAVVQLAIKKGEYNSARDAVDSRGVVIGQNDVQILATRTTGKQVKNPDNSMSEQVLQFIPAKYNEQTELKAEIKAGKNTFDFDLK